MNGSGEQYAAMLGSMTGSGDGSSTMDIWTFGRRWSRPWCWTLAGLGAGHVAGLGAGFCAGHLAGPSTGLSRPLCPNILDSSEERFESYFALPQVMEAYYKCTLLYLAKVVKRMISPR
ncbi:hypothetical protein GOBAR_DD06428 [Gossypium barbadense]|nr:hypothetical protein GOBAR_DD06428 [Gossypium barbadense]